ncbi:MAG: hypothetical protein U0517_02835 [Candidatus Andersenbacteria bacterium]
MGTEQRQRLLVVISGPSGAGKSVVLERLLKKSRRYATVLSTTTRPAGHRKRQDLEYRRVTPKRFGAWRKAGKFVETARVHGYSFGTLWADLERVIRLGKIPVKIIDVKGFAKIRRLHHYRICSFFITTKKLVTLKKRIIRREPDISVAKVRERLQTARRELKHIREYDSVIYNEEGHLGQTVATIQKSIDKCLATG